MQLLLYANMYSKFLSFFTFPNYCLKTDYIYFQIFRIAYAYETLNLIFNYENHPETTKIYQYLILRCFFVLPFQTI